MTGESTRKLGYALGGFVAGGALVYALLMWQAPRDDEERPPIIVKNGSVEFRSTKNWTDDGSQRYWKPDHPNGFKATKFIIKIDKHPDEECRMMEGPVVQVVRSTPNTFPLLVVIGGGEPLVGPKRQLEADNSVSPKTLTYQAGDLVGVNVGDTECTLNTSHEVEIQPVR